MSRDSPRHCAPLEEVSINVPEEALDAYEAALLSVCDAVAFFSSDRPHNWCIEGIKPIGHGEAILSAGLAVAAGVSGIEVQPRRRSIPATGWLKRSYESFPEQLVGRRFAVRGAHLQNPKPAGRLLLSLDAGLAFGSGEHGSTRGCLRALELVARLRPQRIVDLGTGSGILAIAAVRLLRRPVLAIDIDPWAVSVARQNAIKNCMGALMRVRRADGWKNRALFRSAPDLVFANILALPLRKMARDLAHILAPGGTAIISGLLQNQARGVLVTHRHSGLRLEAKISEGTWTTLIVRRPYNALIPSRQ